MTTTTPDDAARLQDLRQHWQASLAVLRAADDQVSGKRRSWHLVIGPTGAGKSSVLINAGLRLCPIADSAPEQLPSTTCFTLWHNQHAVFVEVSGRYVSEAAARSEWRTLLQLLTRERGHHLPLQGVLILKPLAEQLRSGPAAAAIEANLMRERLQDVNDITGAIVPTYVVVTKADLLGGFKEFFAHSERSERAQVLGLTMLWPATADPLQGMIAEYERLLTSLADRRLAALTAAPTETAKRKLMQFPGQLRAALPYLSDYLASAMRPAAGNRPGFRGLYFTSAMAVKPAANLTTPVDPSVPPKSLFLGPASAAVKPSEALKSVGTAEESANALFIRDVFARIILPDSALAVATASAQQRWRALRVACLTVAPLAALLFAAWVGWSAWRGTRVVDDLRQPYAALMEHERTRPADATTRLLALDQLGTALAQALQAHGSHLGAAGTSCATRYVRSLRPLLLDDCIAAVRADLSAVREQTTFPQATKDDPYDLFRAYQMLGGLLEPQPEVIINALSAKRRWFRALEPAGATSEYRLEALAQRQLELCAKVLIPAGHLRIDADLALVESLTREFAERVWMQQAYDQIIREHTPEFGVVLPATLLGDPAHSPLTTSGPVSLLYSQDAWESTVSQAIEDAATTLAKTLTRLNLPHERATIVRRLRERYVADHNQQWLGFITSVRAAQVRDFRDVPGQIERICGPDSPYPRFITRALDQLSLTITGPATATIRSPDSTWVAPCLKALAGLRQDALAYLQPDGGKRLSDIERLRILAARFIAVSAHIGDQLTAIHPPQNRTAIQQGFDAILRSLFADLDQQFARDLDLIWSQQVHQTFTTRFAQRFPFTVDASDDVPMTEFETFFNPINGTVWSVLAQIETLRGLTILGRPMVTLSDESERMLRTAHDIRALFFASNAEALHLRFTYRMQQREHVRDLRMQFGAKTNTLYERPDARYVAEIRRGDPYGAKISLQTAAGQWRHSDDLAGDWGFLRQLRAGNPKSNQQGDLVCTWEYDAAAVDKAATVKASLTLEAGGIDKLVSGELLSGFVLPQHIVVFARAVDR
jgi:type VI protein secretion system component VasK